MWIDRVVCWGKRHTNTRKKRNIDEEPQKQGEYNEWGENWEYWRQNQCYVLKCTYKRIASMKSFLRYTFAMCIVRWFGVKYQQNDDDDDDDNDDSIPF